MTNSATIGSISKLSALAMLSAALLAACASDAPPAADAGAGAAAADAPSRCVQLRNISGYTVIDDQHVVLRGGVSRRYLVTTRSRCTDMRFGAAVATSFGSNARLCPPIVEYVIPREGRRCLIDTVEEVESLEAARALVAQRAQADADTEN